MGMGEQELKDILAKHGKWLRQEPGGERADLSYADLSSADLSSANLRSADLSSADLSSANLRSADLSYADLSSADLSSADLRSANLSSADLSSANLSSADLSYADLSYADLRSIKEDFFKRLSLVKNEIFGLYDFLMRGKIDGTAYEGECACFVGSIANIRKENYLSLSCDLKPDAGSPTEKWFLAIRKGDTPSNNQVAEITKEWLEEFMSKENLAIPKYRLFSNLEKPELFVE